jgi:deoxyribose-phosphate aldolase
MTNEDILRHVDHTLLKATAAWKDIQKLSEEGLRYKTASVCIPPCYVKSVYRDYKGLTICTVIGFPLGYSVTAAKIREAEEALADGAAELDMVINIADVKNGAFDKVRDEIIALKKIAGNKILKVIVETCYLSQEEKIRLCGIVSEAGSDYIKTSTGFGSAGALMEDILLFKEHLGPSVKIKAAGGIKTREDMEAFLSAGCERLGTSSALAILTADGRQAQGY